MVLQFVLFEHAAGYALFAVEENDMLLPQVEESLLSIETFSSIVKLVTFSPFKSAHRALENMIAISQGVLHEDLKLFLETNLPIYMPAERKQQALFLESDRRIGAATQQELKLLLETILSTNMLAERKSPMLCVSDSGIGAAIQNELNILYQTDGVVGEIMRGIRLYFLSLVKGLTAQSASKAQLGLGHSYFEAMVSVNVSQGDNMIMQSIILLDELDKDIKICSRRVRDWYGCHFPELTTIVSDNRTYCRLVSFIRDRKELSEEKLEAIEEIVKDSAKAQAILDASRSSSGVDLVHYDLTHIEGFSSYVLSLSENWKVLHEKLRSKMNQVAPSLSALEGEVVGARLIYFAGSLNALAESSADAVWSSWADKVAFRSRKVKKRNRKNGCYLHFPLIDQAPSGTKNNLSHYLATQCVFAARMDFFSETPTGEFGSRLRKQVEEKLAFYKNRESHKKHTNVAVIVEVPRKALKGKADLQRQLDRERKRNYREKERMVAMASEGDDLEEEQEHTPVKRKWRRKKVSARANSGNRTQGKSEM